MSDLVGNLNCWFSEVEAYIEECEDDEYFGKYIFI